VTRTHATPLVAEVTQPQALQAETWYYGRLGLQLYQAILARRRRLSFWTLLFRATPEVRLGRSDHFLDTDPSPPPPQSHCSTVWAAFPTVGHSRHTVLQSPW
jgi:hypothetical protein